MNVPFLKYLHYTLNYIFVFCLLICCTIPSAWGYKGFDFTKRSDLKSIRAQHIQTGMVARLSERTLLRFYVGVTPEDAQQWVVKMTEHYRIYTPTLDAELSETYGYDIYVAQKRIYFTHRNNVGYCVDMLKVTGTEALTIFLSLEELLLDGDVDNSIIPSIISHASVDLEGNLKDTSHFTIDLPKGVQMLYKGGIIDQQATIIGRKNYQSYIGFQQLPSQIYVFDTNGYGSVFVQDDVLGFKLILNESEANPNDLPQTTEEKVSVPE